MAVDVLEHDDGVVDDEADGEHEREQGQRVDGEIERVHQPEGADQGHRDGDERDQRGAERAQEQEDDQDHEQDGLADGRVDVLHRLPDEDRFVVGDLNLHAFGQRSEDARKRGGDFIGHVERVRGRLLHHPKGDGRQPVGADDAALVEGPELGMADVGEADEIALGVLQDQIVELLRRLEIGLREHRELARHAFDAAGRDVDILPPERVLDVLRREVVGGEPLGIEPDAHRIFAFAEQPDIGDAGQRLQLILDVAVGVVGDFERGMAVAVEGDIEDRLGVGFDLLDHRLLDLVGEMAPLPPDPVAHVRGGRVGVALEIEADADLALLLATDRGDVVDALDAGERILEHLGDLGLDDRRRSRPDRSVLTVTTGGSILGYSLTVRRL